MAGFFSKRRLKIAEQIIIVIFFAVIIPMTISGLIINNINQHSLRAQLREAAVVIANIISEEVDVFNNSIANELIQIATTLKYYNSPELADDYLNTIKKDMSFYKELAIVNENEELKYKHYKENNDYHVEKLNINEQESLLAVIDIKNIQSNIYRTINQNERQIYILKGPKYDLIASVNYQEDVFKSSLSQLPKELRNDETVIFGKIKNQPLAYHKKTNPDLIIIVSTTEAMTKDLIDFNRNRIILAVLLTMLTVFFVVGLYTYYLYINIRQLFKAIIAISKGNYARRIRLLINVFTPFEIVFLGNEFNRMIAQIHKSHMQ